MIKKFGLTITFLILMAAVFLVSGCIFSDDDDSAKKLKTYEGYGEWPEYEGHWSSYTQAAGDKHSTWAYLDININEKGVFSGSYRSYKFDYSWDINTHMGTIPVSVYNPAGTAKAISGAINFESSGGLCTFEGKNETAFDLEINSNNELVFLFPAGFDYSVSIVER